MILGCPYFTETPKNKSTLCGRYKDRASFMFPQRALVHWENPPTTLQLIRRRKIENIQHIFDGI